MHAEDGAIIERENGKRNGAMGGTRNTRREGGRPISEPGSGHCTANAFSFGVRIFGQACWPLSMPWMHRETGRREGGDGTHGRTSQKGLHSVVVAWF